jgi:uncharacterized protein YggU (UPF0235/DUF167 family)
VPLEIRDKGDGATLRVRCRPGAPRSRPTGEHAGAWKLDVAAPPERGLANDEVRRLVAELCGLRAAAIRVLTGAASREKTLLVSGITAADLARRIAAVGSPEKDR